MASVCIQAACERPSPKCVSALVQKELGMSSERASVHHKHFPWNEIIYAALFISLVSAGLYLGYLAYARVRDFAANTQFKSIPIIPAPVGEQQSPSTDYQAEHPVAEGQQVQVPAKSEIYPDIENKERVNILFLGIDQRPGESVACRTDTMILVSINPKDMSASLLSIPRDLWVPIGLANHPEGKINTAHYWGEVEHYPGGGPALAKHTVRYNFGVPVHYYVRLNFVGFEQIIDTIGGIDIDVPTAIDDPLYPNGNLGYEHLYIEAGPQHFDGTMALKYARTRRGTGDGDFSRMQRQQQVILAVRDRVLSLPNLPQLVVQLPQLVRNMGDALETDIPLDVMFTLAKWAQQIDRDNIRMDSLDL
jgi:LCP family protein required for cell wall assembly